MTTMFGQWVCELVLVSSVPREVSEQSVKVTRLLNAVANTLLHAHEKTQVGTVVGLRHGLFVWIVGFNTLYSL